MVPVIKYYYEVEIYRIILATKLLIINELDKLNISLLYKVSFFLLEVYILIIIFYYYAIYSVLRTYV